MEQLEITLDDRKKFSRQCNTILALLRRGPVTTATMIDLRILRGAARIHELRKRHQIDSKRLTGGVWEYRLHGA